MAGDGGAGAGGDAARGGLGIVWTVTLKPVESCKLALTVPPCAMRAARAVSAVCADANSVVATNAVITCGCWESDTTALDSPTVASLLLMADEPAAAMDASDMAMAEAAEALAPALTVVGT